MDNAHFNIRTCSTENLHGVGCYPKWDYFVNNSSGAGRGWLAERPPHRSLVRCVLILCVHVRVRERSQVSHEDVVRVLQDTAQDEDHPYDYMFV